MINQRRLGHGKQGSHSALHDARPVYKAIRELEKRCGCYMTYEVRPMSIQASCGTPRIPIINAPTPMKAPAFLPKQHRLNFTFKDLQNNADKPDLQKTIAALLASHKASRNPGFFTFDHIGAVHVHLGNAPDGLAESLMEIGDRRKRFSYPFPDCFRIYLAWNEVFGVLKVLFRRAAGDDLAGGTRHVT